jgi:hypothetical protein
MSTFYYCVSCDECLPSDHFKCCDMCDDIIKSHYIIENHRAKKGNFGYLCDKCNGHYAYQCDDKELILCYGCNPNHVKAIAYETYRAYADKYNISRSVTRSGNRRRKKIRVLSEEIKQYELSNNIKNGLYNCNNMNHIQTTLKTTSNSTNVIIPLLR